MWQKEDIDWVKLEICYLYQNVHYGVLVLVILQYIGVRLGRIKQDDLIRKMMQQWLDVQYQTMGQDICCFSQEYAPNEFSVLTDVINLCRKI